MTCPMCDRIEFERQIRNMIGEHLTEVFNTFCRNILVSYGKGTPLTKELTLQEAFQMFRVFHRELVEELGQEPEDLTAEAEVATGDIA